MAYQLMGYTPVADNTNREVPVLQNRPVLALHESLDELLCGVPLHSLRQVAGSPCGLQKAIQDLPGREHLGVDIGMNDFHVFSS